MKKWTNMIEGEWKGYLHEKAMSALESTTYSIEEWNRQEGKIPSDILDNIRWDFQIILAYLTKVVAVLEDALDKHDDLDAEIIVSKGITGLQEVLFKYGAIPEPDHLRRKRETPEFIDNILRIVGNDNRSARRDFYDAIETFGLRDPLAK